MSHLLTGEESNLFGKWNFLNINYWAPTREQQILLREIRKETEWETEWYFSERSTPAISFWLEMCLNRDVSGVEEKKNQLLRAVSSICFLGRI